MSTIDVYQDLPDQIRQGNCALVLGTGIYRGTALPGGQCIPDNAALAREFAARSEYKVGPLDWPHVAAFYEYKKTLPQLVADLKACYAPFARTSLPTLQVICRLPFKAIFTTCIDSLLENELGRQDRPVKKILLGQRIGEHEAGARPEALAQLRQRLTERFSEDEVRTLYFDLNVDYENLGGSTKDGKVRALIDHFENRHSVYDLVKRASINRPDLPWKDLFEAIVVTVSPGDRLLVKLCGTLEDPQSLVLTQDQYNRFFIDLAHLTPSIKALCADSTLLFVGFDLEDEISRQLYDVMTSEVACSVRQAYVFDGTPSDFVRNWWQQHNAAIVHVEAVDWLTELERLVSMPTIEEEYSRLLEACQGQTRQQLKEFKGRKYDPDLYVAREAEARLQDFLVGDKNGLILIGESGTGKTNLLCHLAEKWIEDEHLVLYYDCGGSLGIDVEGAIIRDLPPAAPGLFDVRVEQIAAWAQAKGKCVIWLLDGVNEFRDGENLAGELLKRLDAIIGRVHQPNVKLVVSCRTGTWDNLVMLGRTHLFWNKYYPSPEQPVCLDRFTPEEFRVAYGQYQQKYRIGNPLKELTPDTRERLRDPLLLQMTAITYTGQRVPDDALSLKVLQEYCARQTGQRVKDNQFLTRFATVLLEQGVQTIPLDQMVENTVLGDEIADDRDCAYKRARDGGLLTEVRTGPERLVRFTYDRVLEFYVAKFWRGQVRKAAEMGQLLEQRLPAYEQFAPAWAGAAMAVALDPSEASLLRLSQSLNYRVRQVAVESLVALHRDTPDQAKRLLHYLVTYREERPTAGAAPAPDRSGAELPLRTALKVARQLGEEGSDFFVEAAASEEDRPRDTVANELYVLWQQNPALGFSILRRIIASINPGLSAKLGRWLGFAARFSLLLFANHCHQPEIIQQLSDIWWDEFEDKYKIDRWFGIQVAQDIVDVGIRAAAQIGIAGAMMETITFGGKISLDRFFADADLKASTLRVADYLDPATDMTAALPDLVRLFSSDLIYPNTLAAVCLAVHTYRDFEGTQAAWQQLIESLSGTGRLWLLLAFIIVAPTDVPPEPLKERVAGLTWRILEENRADFIAGPVGIFDEVDIGLLPLGMTCGKLGLKMDDLSVMLRESEAGDDVLLARLVRGLAAIGLYYPDAALGLLREIPAERIAALPLRNTAVRCLATIGVLHGDPVERFLAQVGADENLHDEVEARKDASLVKLYMDVIGLYNVSAVGCLYYPHMRKMVQSSFRAATECKDLAGLIARITQNYIQLVVDSGYRIIRMIDRD